MSKGKDYENVKFHISRQSHDKYQIILVDSNGDIQMSQKVAEKFAKSLAKSYKTFEFYIWTEYSGISPPSAMKKAGNIFGLLFGLGLVGAFVYLAYMNYKKTPMISLHDFTSRITTNLQVNSLFLERNVRKA